MDQAELRKALMREHLSAFAWAGVCCDGDRHFAEDVLQSVYLKVLDGKAHFAGRSAFRTWLFGVIRNTARHHFRQRFWARAVRLDFSLLTSAEAAESALDSDAVATVRKTLKSLPRRQRQLAHLVFYEGLSIRQAAEVLGIHIGTARQHYSRAKETLKARLKHLDSVEEQSDERSLR